MYAVLGDHGETERYNSGNDGLVPFRLRVCIMNIIGH
jgi:hypothetical protein